MINDITSRKMPFNLEAEQAVLGSILIDPERFNAIANIISAQDFYLEEHREIYLAMQKLFLQNREIDLVTLIDTMVQNGIYDRDRSVEYIKLICEIVPSAANIVDYAQIVKNKSLLRQLIDTCGEITDMAFTEQDDAKEIIDIAESKIFKIAKENESRDFTHIRDVLVEAYGQLRDLKNNRAEAMGTKTGFSGLDNVLVGMGKGDLVLVGARPGMGKTSFALNIATNVAKATKRAVCIFSLEMSNVQLVSRMLSAEALVDSHNIRSGMLSDEEWDKLAKTSSILSECDIYIDDSTGLTVTGMKAKLRRIKNLGLVVIDYLQLMQSDRKTENRVQEVAEISRNLKLLAKELGVPVVTCAQLSRGPESRSDKRPMLSDLRDSGAIEQDADVVMFLFRDDYYTTSPENVSKAEVIVAKNRHGATSTVEMGWIGKYTKFVTMTDMNER